MSFLPQFLPESVFFFGPSHMESGQHPQISRPTLIADLVYMKCGGFFSEGKRRTKNWPKNGFLVGELLGGLPRWLATPPYSNLYK